MTLESYFTLTEAVQSDHPPYDDCSLATVFSEQLTLRRCLASSGRNYDRTMSLTSSVAIKKLPNVYKSCKKNDFTRKMIDYNTFTKIA